jgi:Ca2+-binding RTX toxin-like protein
LLSFFPAVNYTAGTRPFAVAVGDFNHDGIQDLAVANVNSNNLSILLGNADGTFQSPVNYATDIGPGYVAAADFNHDGKLDLAVANSTSNDVSILLGNGDGTFQNAVNYPVGSLPHDIAVGDLNGDGKPDLVVTNFNSNTVSVLLGNGDGTFQAAVNYTTGTEPHSVALADFNGDGKLDLAMVHVGDNDVSILLGNGNGTFQPPVNYAVGANPVNVAVGDFNRDGKLDLAVANQHSASVSILLGNGDGTFQAASSVAVGSQPRNVVAADFDRDGKLDLAVTDFGDNNVALLLGNGDGSFQAPSFYPVGTGPDRLAVGDFNGDGYPDLVAINSFSNNFSVLFNQHTVVNAGPGATINEGDTFSATGSFSGFPGSQFLGTVDYGDGLPAPPHIVSYYRFEEGSGTDVINSVNGSHDGTLSSVTYTPDVPVTAVPQTGQADNYSLRFNGSGQALVNGNFIFNSGYGDATLEFWLKAPDTGHEAIFLGRPDDNDTNRFHIYLFGSGYGVPLSLGMDYGGPSGPGHPLLQSPGPGNTAFTIPPNTWTHVAITRTGNAYRFYKNGFLVYTAVDANPNLPTTSAWTISGRSAFRFTGQVDEVRFADSALTPTQFLDNPPGQPLTLNADGTFNLSHVYQDNGTYLVKVTVRDNTGALATKTLAVTVNNVPPTASVSGPADGVRGQPRQFVVSATDPSPVDQAAGFAYAIDWGDGTTQAVPRTPGNGGGTPAEHVYARSGTYTVQVTATDKDGGTSLAATRQIVIKAVALQPDPEGGPGATALVVGGTPGDDVILFRPGAHAGDVAVSLNGHSLGTYRPTSRIIAYGGAGDDVIIVSPDITLPAWLYGGEGNNILVGGGGNNVLVGGSGDDLLIGGRGRNLLIGGLGADWLVGGPDSDILIAGSTAFDNNDAALFAIMAEWTSARDYSTRIANLQGTGTGPRLNGSFYLIASGPGRTVFDDGAVDVLTGGAGQDWFFANLTGDVKDRITDLRTDEVVSDTV